MSLLKDIVARSTGDGRPATLGEVPMSYAELAARARRLAQHVRDCGVRPGQLVAVALPQGAAHVTALLAVRLAGTVIVPVNPLATQNELEHVLDDSGACLLLVPEGHALAEGREAIDGVALVETARSRKGYLGEDVDFVIYTSGSTGRPKGVILPQSAFAANVSAVSRFLDLSPADRTAVFTPPQYSSALSQILLYLSAGGAVLPVARGLLNPVGLLEQTREAGVTGLQLNASMLRTLLDTADEALAELSLRYVLLVGQPVTRALLVQLQSLWPATDVMLGYGCTENGPRVTMGRQPRLEQKTEAILSAGTAIAGTEISIRDDQGSSLPAGTVGEICIRGSSLMRGYLNDEPGTQARFVDGWFRTRDLGTLDVDGNLIVSGRLDNVILVGQEKVSAEDVEEAIAAVAGVLDCAVCAARDERYFEVPVALLVADGPAPVDAVRRHLRTVLSRAKQPVRYHQVQAIPRTPHGKIDRAATRRLVLELEAAGGASHGSD